MSNVSANRLYFLFFFPYAGVSNSNKSIWRYNISHNIWNNLTTLSQSSHPDVMMKFYNNELYK